MRVHKKPATKGLGAIERARGRYTHPQRFGRERKVAQHAVLEGAVEGGHARRLSAEQAHPLTGARALVLGARVLEAAGLYTRQLGQQVHRGHGIHVLLVQSELQVRLGFQRVPTEEAAPALGRSRERARARVRLGADSARRGRRTRFLFENQNEPVGKLCCAE